jgi:nucleoside-diphosphate-sugar epimerase
LIYLSSQAAAGPCAAKPGISERLYRPQPVSAYGRSKLAAERLIGERRHENAVILRPAIVYGPGDREMLQLCRYAQRGIIPVAGYRDFPVNTIYIEDLIAAIMLAAEREKALGNTYFVHDGISYEWKEICRLVAESVGKKALILPVAMAVIRLFCQVCSLYGRFTGNITIVNTDKYREIAQQGWLCNCDAIAKDLQFVSRWHFQEAFTATVQWYYANGWLHKPVNRR